MPRPLLIYPGEVGPLVEVQELLAERHEDLRVQRATEIDEAKAKGTPLDKLEPLPPYKPDPRIDGIRIQCRVLSEQLRRGAELQESAAFERFLRAHKLEDPDARACALEHATNNLFEVRRAFIRDAVVEIEIDGEGSFKATPEGGLERICDILERSHLFTPVYLAAKAAQEMPLGKAWRSGPLPASTSTGSTAPPAQSIDVRPGAATVALEGLAVLRPTSTANGFPATPARGGT